MKTHFNFGFSLPSVSVSTGGLSCGSPLTDFCLPRVSRLTRVPARSLATLAVLHEGLRRFGALRGQKTMARSCASARASCFVGYKPLVWWCTPRQIGPRRPALWNCSIPKLAIVAATGWCSKLRSLNVALNARITLRSTGPPRQASLARSAVRGTFSPTGPSRPAAAVRLSQTLGVSMPHHLCSARRPR